MREITWTEKDRKTIAKFMSSSRQSERRALFQSSFAVITKNYGGEPRRNRRRMAINKMHNLYSEGLLR